MKLPLILIAALAISDAQAQTVGVHLESHHYPSRDSYNNENLGAYVKLDGGLTFGAYRNTYRRESFYVGQTFHVGAVDITLGAVSGYQLNHRATILPMFVPSVGLGTYWGVTPRLFLLPAGKTTVAHLGLETQL